MEITEKWLGEIGGWAAMKAARALVAAGAVSDVSREGDIVRGMAGSGKNRVRAGLRVRSRTDVENLCGCAAARSRGLMCEHSLAVALMSIAAGQAPGSAGATMINQTTALPAAAAAAVAGMPKGRFSVFLPNELLDGMPARSTAVFLKFEAGGDEVETALGPWLIQHGLKLQTMPLSLAADDLVSLLKALGGHQRVFRGKPGAGMAGAPDNPRVMTATDATRLPLRVAEAANRDVICQIASDSIVPVLVARGQRGAVAETWWFCRATESLFWLDAPEDADVSALLGELAANRGMQTSPRHLHWLVRRLDSVEQMFQLEFEGPTVANLKVLPVPCEFHLLVDGSSQAVEAELTACFRDRHWPIAKSDWDSKTERLFPIEDPANPAVFYIRNRQREAAAMKILEAAGFAQGEGGRWRIVGPERVLGFYGSELPRLERVFKVEQAERWRSATRNWLRVVPKARLAGGGSAAQSGLVPSGASDWLSLDFSYEAASGFHISRNDVMQMMRTGRRGLQGKDGRRYVLDVAACEDFEESLRDIEVKLHEKGATVPAEYTAYLIGDEALDRPMIESKSAQVIRGQLGTLGQQLRDYQLDSVRWMEALARSGKGGLLADDMGLGKTVQCIALLRLRLGQQDADKRLSALVVCPKSLIANWEAELRRFAPELQVVAATGPDRKTTFKAIHQKDVILTTYQLLVRDLAIYQRHSFEVIVLDEASYIRNPDTEAAKALRQLSGRSRFALTGTPIENSVRDLWSIFQFLQPGYLGSRERFLERFELSLQADQRSGGGEASRSTQRLRRLVRPFFLRRTKAEVLPELPEKIEQILWCELSGIQREVYKRILEEGQEEVRQSRRRLGTQRARMTMFTVLLRLRQACCDLRLTGLPAHCLPYEPNELSGKLPVCQERLSEVIAKGEKILVFSQFVSFLRLMRNNLEGQGIRYSYLDGSTADRASAVHTFQSDPDCRVFFISLKAGGYGLNLTAASHILLLDPWWNPAVEVQAIDRSHRMGQNRAVTALRLITRGTVEEKILALQARKRGLVEAALSEDDAPADIASIEDRELEELVGL